jgi:hypothetical protein
MDDGLEQVVDRTPMTRDAFDLNRGQTLDAEDLGCAVGQAYRVDLVFSYRDGTDETVDSYATTAQ